jgi:hypothetical protein
VVSEFQSGCGRFAALFEFEILALLELLNDFYAFGPVGWNP